jgi:hypothetical protein
MAATPHEQRVGEIPLDDQRKIGDRIEDLELFPGELVGNRETEFPDIPWQSEFQRPQGAAAKRVGDSVLREEVRETDFSDTQRSKAPVPIISRCESGPNATTASAEQPRKQYSAIVTTESGILTAEREAQPSKVAQASAVSFDTGSNTTDVS